VPARAPHENRLYLGVDFGTTNTVVSVSDRSGVTTTLAYSSAQGALSTFRSVLCYVSDDAESSIPHSRVYCGPAAIDAFLAHGEEARLIQSVKTFLSSKTFAKSTIHGRDYTLEQIVADFLRGLVSAAQWPDDFVNFSDAIMVGRPVKFAGSSGNTEEALAESRLRNAFSQAGFTNINLALEPQAAAYFFARQLSEPATVLVADFGGGTSDFSIVKFDPHTGTAQALAHAGVGVAGDTLDFRIIDNVVAPALGKGSQYRPENKWLEVEHWHRLSFLKRPDVLRELRKIEVVSDSPEKIAQLRIFIEQEMGFHLYQAVNRCKTALSTAEHAQFNFSYPPIELNCTVSRDDFEHWIERDVSAIDAACSDALTQAKLTEQDISVVFMTGGTSFVPAIRKRFESRFGRQKIVAGGEFVSVASGLALLARERAHQ
jgi:hypothetical chaperone protein